MPLSVWFLLAVVMAGIAGYQLAVLVYHDRIFREFTETGDIRK